LPCRKARHHRPTLYRTLYALHQNLDNALGPGTATAMLGFEGGVLGLAPSVWVDVREFEALCATPPSAPPGQRAAALGRALALYEGDLLPDDRYAEWTLLPGPTSSTRPSPGVSGHWPWREGWTRKTWSSMP